MKFLRVIGSLAAIGAGALLALVFLETTFFSERLFTLYAGRLDSWVASGAPPASFQSDVVKNCGKLTLTQAGFFGYMSLSTFQRDELDFRVDVCSKMTVNRVYKQPEFENPTNLRLICEGSQPLFKRFCSLWIKKTGNE
jgi:hypothetical protein